MPNAKFQLWRGSELRASFSSSETKALSLADQKQICELLKIPFESVWFAVTNEDVDSSQLSEPAFENSEGRKFWLFPEPARADKGNQPNPS
jgi:hypothetical protein